MQNRDKHSSLFAQGICDDGKKFDDIVALLAIAEWMVWICCATTDNTSISIRLNSSKQAWKQIQNKSA
jgi:hypothetical protein